MEHLSNDHKNGTNKHKNSHELCDETGNPLFNFTQNQWKLGQERDQDFSMEKKPL